jgi:hypothetical protein
VTNCTTPKIEFSRLKRRKVEAEFSGGEIGGFKSEMQNSHRMICQKTPQLASQI